MCTDVHIKIIIHHHVSKETGCQRIKTKPDSDSDGGENHTCLRLQQLQKNLFVACYWIYLSSASQVKFFFCIYIHGVQKWLEKNMYLDALSTSESTCCFWTSGSLTHETSTGARTGISQFVRGFSKYPDAFQTLFDAWPTLKLDDLIIKQNRPVPIQCMETPCGCRPGTIRCPVGVNDPTKCQTGYVKF